MSRDSILISGARQHNLRNITVEIPRDRVTVITGLSGSGKSSLAFDTLYAEGQRRYVESLSAYARQFLHQMQKPDVDHIEGLSPAIAIEQRTAGSNPRSTVATATEIHDYLRLLYGNVGHANCPHCGRPVTRQTAQQMVDLLLTRPNRTRVSLLAPKVRGRKGSHDDLLQQILRDGFIRVRVDGKVCEIDELKPLARTRAHTIDVVVDRLVITNRIRPRLTDSVELALKQGGESLIALCQEEGLDTIEEVVLSERHACNICGVSFEELTPRHFSFNSPDGACSTCSGLGTLLVFDESLIVPDDTVSIDDGAIRPWRSGGRRLILYYKRLLRALAKHYGFSLTAAYKDLPAETRTILMHGSGAEEIEFGYWRGGGHRTYQKPFEGVIPNLARRFETTAADTTRQRLRRFMTKHGCPDCKGTRLKPEVAACTVDGVSIVDVAGMSVGAASSFFQKLALPEREAEVASEVLREIRRRLSFLDDVGLGYLTLDRESGTLSGGEAQRIRLATQIGSGLAGVLYVLDEPTIGLHGRDTARLISILKALRDIGNTVVVVEHDAQMIRQADHVIDLGPGAGRLGGDVVVSGSLDDLLAHETSLTARYLVRSGRSGVPDVRVKPAHGYLKVIGAAENNLKGIDVSIPLGLLVCVAGVSGSGKSSLVDSILRRALFRHFYRSKETPGLHRKITGLEHLDKAVVIDQSAIGRTPRSNPVTYTGAFAFIRALLAATPAAKIRGYGPGRFSFNVKGGRCEVCRGDGLLKLEMHFLPDVYVTCEACGGLRYNRETLEVRYGGRNVAEILAMTVDEALDAFRDVPNVARRLETLSDVGLGYLQLGQSATTLSGGEAQRVKLSAELSKKGTGRTLYLLDEPTTGLHFADTSKLLSVLCRLRDSGNTIVVVEHNLDVIKAADHIIDLGPEGGDAGGEIVVEGTPEEVAKCSLSHTGKLLSRELASE